MVVVIVYQERNFSTNFTNSHIFLVYLYIVGNTSMCVLCYDNFNNHWIWRLRTSKFNAPFSQQHIQPILYVIFRFKYFCQYAYCNCHNRFLNVAVGFAVVLLAVFNRSLEWRLVNICCRCQPKGCLKGLRQDTWDVIRSVSYVIVLLCIGTIFFYFASNKAIHPLESFAHSVSTITTIGYGALTNVTTLAGNYSDHAGMIDWTVANYVSDCLHALLRENRQC